MLKIEIGACKNAKNSNLVSLNFILFFVCHIWMYILAKNAKKIVFQFVLGWTKKSLVLLDYLFNLQEIQKSYLIQYFVAVCL